MQESPVNIVEVLDTRYLPMLRQIATRLRERHPTFTFHVSSWPHGSRPAFQAHDLYLEAMRPDSANPEPNCVVLAIGVRDLPGIPRLYDLGVGWGGDGVPPPTGGLDLLRADISFGPEALRAIDEALPQLERHLHQCLSDWEATYPQTRGA